MSLGPASTRSNRRTKHRLNILLDVLQGRLPGGPELVGEAILRVKILRPLIEANGRVSKAVNSSSLDNRQKSEAIAQPS